MAIAALALEPLIAKYGDPEEAVKALESAAAEARSLSHKIAHSASLTERENYEGWLPLLLVLYRVWQTFLGPQVEFSILTQIGLAKVLNRFGAGIDTSRLEKIAGTVQKSISPFDKGQTSQPGISSGSQWFGSDAVL